MRSMSRTPLFASSRSADWQKGHAAVRYISTRAMPALPLFLHRKAGLLPRGQSTREIHHSLESLLLQGRNGLRRALAGLAIDDDRLVLALQLGRLHAGHRQVFRAQDVAGLVLRLVTHVHEYRVLPVDELRRFARRNARPAGRAAHERPDQHGARSDGCGEQKGVMVLLEELD